MNAPADSGERKIVQAGQAFRRRIGTGGVLAGLVLAGVLLAGCASTDRDRDRERLLELVETADWPQVRSEVAGLRQAGTVAPWLDYAEGLAALQGGDEDLARRMLAAAAQRDPALAPAIARAWARASIADHEAGWRERATARMAEAVVTDPTTDPGPQLPAVAGFLYRNRKDYDAAWPLYERLVRERPEPQADVPAWVYRWGHLHELRGDLDGARAIYEQFIAEFPADKEQGRFVHWRYLNVLIEQAQRASEAGDRPGALALLELARQDGWHVDQQQRTEFLTGQILEAQGQPALARDHYQKVVEYGEVLSTEVVDDARRRLEAIDAQDR